MILDGQIILHPNQDDITELFQNQETPQFNILPDTQKITTILQNIPDPSETATIQNVSHLSKETTNDPNNPQITITGDSNILQIPVHKITQNTINNQTPNDAIHITNRDNTSILSTSNPLITQEFQTQQTLPRNYDPPPSPYSNYST